MRLQERTHLGQVRVLRRAAEDALKAYGQDASLKFIYHGENTTFRVDGSTRQLLRIHRNGYQTAKTIQSELMWLEALHDAGIEAPRPVQTTDGDWVAKVDVKGDIPRNATLLRWVDGAMMGAKVSQDRLCAMGRSIAALHVHVESFALPTEFERKKLDCAGLFGGMMGGGIHQVFGDNRALFEDVEGRLAELISALGDDQDVFGLIHADLHYENMVFPPRHQKISRAIPIDFDDSAFGYFAYDLAVMIGALERMFPGMHTRKIVLDGYREVRNLPASIEDTIDDFLIARVLAITYWVLSRTDSPNFVARAPGQMARACASFKDYLQ